MNRSDPLNKTGTWVTVKGQPGVILSPFDAGTFNVKCWAGEYPRHFNFIPVLLANAPDFDGWMRKILYRHGYVQLPENFLHVWYLIVHDLDDIEVMYPQSQPKSRRRRGKRHRMKVPSSDYTMEGI